MLSQACQLEEMPDSGQKHAGMTEGWEWLINVLVRIGFSLTRMMVDGVLNT